MKYKSLVFSEIQFFMNYRIIYNRLISGRHQGIKSCTLCSVRLAVNKKGVGGQSGDHQPPQIEVRSKGELFSSHAAHLHKRQF